MIFRTCLSPRVFDPELHGDSDTYFPLALTLLRDFEENCVILVDSERERTTTKGLHEYLAKWPVKYRKPAKEILSRMLERKRFVPVAGCLSAPSCGSMPCRYSIGIALTHDVEALFVSPNCEATVRGLVTGSAPLTVGEYPISLFSTARASARQLRISSGVMTQSQAETQVFGRILTTATHVTIVDRYVGRSMLSRAGRVAPLSSGYKTSLTWLAQLHKAAVESGNRASKATFEVWCGLETNSMSSSDISAAVALLREWEATVLASGVPNFRIHIKKETHRGSLPHARFLVTDQIAVLVERGFDILFSDSQMITFGLDPVRDERRLKDCVVVLSPDARSAITEIRRLDDAS